MRRLVPLLLLLCTPIAQAQVTDVYLPKIAVAPDGAYALAAEALVRTSTGRDVLNVIVQRYSPDGAAVGPTHLIGGESCSGLDIWLSDFMQRPEIRFQPNGTLVVLMQHTGEFQLAGDGVRSSEMTLAAVDVNGQLLDLAPQYSSCVQQKLIFPGGSRQDRPRLAISPQGALLVTGDGFFNDADLRNVALRVLDAAGNEVIEQVIPHDDPASQSAFHMQPDVATNGQLILMAWHECPVVDNQGNANTCDIGAQFASVTATDLQAVGANIRVNAGDPPGTLQLYPSAAMNSAGQSVVVWADARDGDQGEIYAQRFDATGNQVGANIKVSQGQGIIDSRPEVAMLENGRSMVVWTDSLNGRYTARARVLDLSGTPEGDAFELAPGAAQSGQPAVAADGNGFAYIYLSAGSTGATEIGSNKTTSLTSVEEGSSEPDTPVRSIEVFPNPFTDDAAVRWHLAKPGNVTVRLFDVLGREVAVLADATYTAGQHEVRLSGHALPPGIYVVEIRQQESRTARTIVRTR